MNPDEDARKVEQLLEVPKLAEALESDQFKQFLDHVPFAVAVSEMQPSERMVYANLEFERLTGGGAERDLWQAMEFAAQKRGRQR
jgi:PAS domain-containing protein